MSGGDLNKGLLSRPGASSAHSSLTVRLKVRLRRLTQKSRCCVLDTYVEVVPCSGWRGHVRRADPPAPDRHNPPGVLARGDGACKSIADMSTAIHLHVFIQF